MQSDQDTFKLTTPPPASPTQPSPPSAPPPDTSAPTYTPRTVWQTPHGLPPNFNRHRNPRPTRVSKIMRRCLRLMYRFSPAPHPTLAFD